MPALMSGQVSVEKLAEMMKPKKVEGKWRKPELSRRIIAKVRKAWLTDGREWPFEKPRTNYGGWAIEDLPKVKQKGKKVDRLAVDRYVITSWFLGNKINQEPILSLRTHVTFYFVLLFKRRQKHIEERMKVMPQLIEEYREKYRAWRRCDGMSPVDKTFMTPKQLRKKQKAQQN